MALKNREDVLADHSTINAVILRITHLFELFARYKSPAAETGLAIFNEFFGLFGAERHIPVPGMPILRSLMRYTATPEVGVHLNTLTFELSK